MIDVDFRANPAHSFPEYNHVSKSSSLAVHFVIGNKGNSFNASLYYLQHLANEQGGDSRQNVRKYVPSICAHIGPDNNN